MNSARCSVKAAVRYFEAARLPLIVRVPAQENDMLARACDMGAEGLIAPMISTAAQAQAMVDSVKYFPDGKRGVGLQMAHDNYRAAPVADALAAANARTARKHRMLHGGLKPLGCTSARSGVEMQFQRRFRSC